MSLAARGCGVNQAGQAGIARYTKRPARRRPMIESLEPIEVAMDFIKRINAGNVDALCELMTEKHVFHDAVGKRFVGRETLRQRWKAYFTTHEALGQRVLKDM